MRVPGLLRDDDAVGKQSSRLFQPPQTRKKLAELEIAGNIFRVRIQERLEMARGGSIVSELCALKRETIARECVAGFLGDELLKDFATRLLRLGHGMNDVL